MSMTSIQLREILEEKFSDGELQTSYQRDKDTFRVEWKKSMQGITIKLSNVLAKYHQRGQVAIDELVHHIEETLKMMNEQPFLTGKERHVYPVIRSTSFPTESKAGTRLITKEHTAETRIYYALDVGKSYRLIDEKLLESEQWTEKRLDEMALFNIRSLKNEYKVDRVADNDFYFIASQDGYDASRILNIAFLEEMKANSKGNLAVAVPHQDVLIIADIQNDMGYDILAQLTMQFFAEGRIPITSLPFIYENKELEPIFILAKKRRQK